MAIGKGNVFDGTRQFGTIESNEEVFPGIGSEEGRGEASGEEKDQEGSPGGIHTGISWMLRVWY